MVTYASPYYSSSNNYAFDSNNAWGGYGSGVTFTGPEGGSTNLNETAMGTITTTFTWQPSYAGEPAPASAIVAQHCTAGWVGHLSGTGMPTGRCDNGLGGSLVLYYEAGTCDSTKYTVKAANADGSVTVLCSPSVHLDCESGTNGTAGGSVTVSYSATVYPVTINLIGQNPANQALTGQQITASLLIPNGLPSGTKITSYTWLFDSEVVAKPANPIKNWDGTASGDNTHPQLVPLTAADLTGTDTGGNGISVNSLSFYDQYAESLSVKCAVSLKFPDGTAGSVNAQSVPVAFLKPSSSWTINPSSLPTGFFIDQVNKKFGVNVVWEPEKISVPPPFTGGTGCFVQIITPSGTATRYPNAGKPSKYSLKKPVVNPDGTTSWVAPPEALDIAFPYPFGYTVNADGTLNPTPIMTNYTWAATGAGASGDTPSQTYMPPDVDGGGTNWYTATNSDSFTTWLMYKPPSTNAIWVPLSKLKWSVNATVLAAGGQWLGNPDDALPSPTLTTTNTPPMWTVIGNAAQQQLRP